MRRSRSIIRGTLGILFGTIASLATAEPPSGHFEIPFSGPQRIWNPVGEDFDGCETISEDGLDVTICGDATSTVDASGQLDGSASFEFTGDIEGTLQGTLSGNVKGSDRADDKAKFTLTLEGPLTLVGFGTLMCEGTGKATASVTEDGLVTGAMKMKFCLNGIVQGRRVRGCESSSVDVTDVAVGGDWNLAVDLIPGAGDLVTGVASAAMADGEIYEFTVAGKHNAKKNESTLKLTPSEPDSEGASGGIKKLTTTGESLTGGQLDFKIRGIKGKSDL